MDSESAVVPAKAPITGIAPVPRRDHRGKLTEKTLDECLTKHNGDREKVCAELGLNSTQLRQKLTYYRVLFHKWGKRNGNGFAPVTVEENLETFLLNHSAAMSYNMEKNFGVIDRIHKRLEQANRDPVNYPMSDTEFDSLIKALTALSKENRESVVDIAEILTERAKVKSKVRTPDRQGGKLPPMGATSFGPKGQTVVKVQNAVISMNGAPPQLPTGE